MNFLLGQTYEIENLISREGKFTENEFQDVIIETKRDIRKYGITNCDILITTTKEIELVDNKQFLNIEILIPVCCRVYCDAPYNFKEKIKIVNALYIRENNIANINNTMEQINQYINENNLQPITPAYLVQKKLKDNIITDIYISINPNIL